MTTRDEFAKSVVASGLLSADDLQTFWQRIPAPQRPKDGETLGAVLVQQSRLTEYQKQELLAGRGKNLILGNYVILDKLGQGGMGMVLKAEHKRMRRIVALKVLAPNVTKSPEALARFQREVMAAAKLRHPNIVAADDADEANGTHFLVMEYVEGRDLAATVRAHGTLPPAEAVRCVLQAARGLEYAHQKGVVHRDIKPHNLILDATGTVKILDMGLARLESAGGDQDQLTGTGQIMGTVDYMAPEQAMDTKHADARADIYALGATPWFLVVGRAMYDGDTMLKKLLAHQQSPIPTFAAAGVAVAPLVQEVFQRMVAKSLGDRYPSMREAIVDLERCLIDHSHAPTAMVSSSVMGRLAEQVPAVSWPGGPTSQGIATGAAAPVEAPPIVFATSASAPAGEATMALSRTDADTNPQPLSFVTPATSIRTRRPPARPLPSRKMMVLVGGGVAALVVSLVTTAIMLSRSPTPATNSQTAATSNRPNVAASKPKGPPPPLAIAPFDAAAAKKHQQAWADYLGMPVEKEIKLPGNVPLVMVLVPPGEFMRSEDGQPQFKVRITKPFYMGKYEVTQAQWQAVMGTNPSKFKDDPANLVERVSWDDTQPFLTKLNDTRLVNQWRFVRPTEAQWEYACRAGTTTVFPFGNSEIILAEYAWYQASSQNRAHAVGQLKPNAFGLYDMLGNVWEWCDDWHMGGYYAQAPQDDPSGPTIGSARVLRGGYYQTEAGGCRPAARTLRAPSFRQNDLGFRLAMTPSDEFLSRLDGNQSTSVATKGTPATSAPVANAASSDIASAVQGLGKGPPPPLAIAPFDAAMAKKHQQAWADYLGMPVELEIKLPGNVPLIMVLIPPGEFMRSEDGQPQFKVQITKPFYLGKYEVTQAQWQAVMGSNPSMLKDDSSNPVEQVSWDDTDPFLTKLNDARLVNQWRFGRPTEAQWEYACRAGTTTLFPFGDSEVILPKHAWYLASSRGKPHLVGQHEPNAFELRDMLGNVWEWCDDWYMEAYYAQAPKYDPTGPTEGSDRGIRGGSYADTAGNCRPAYRSRLAPSFRGNNVGIRLALSFVGVPDKPGKEKR